MAELVVAAAGAAIGGAIAPVGFSFLGMSGAGLGWGIGSLIGSAFGPKQKSSGPRQGDLKVTGSGYGVPVPWVAGSPRVGGTIIWASDKRETANTTEVGKGGGSEYTEYTYDCDILYMLTENEIDGVSRIWSNGKLVYAGGVVFNGFCDAVTVYTGAADQLPDPTYEAAVGAGNAPAYRTRGTVMIQGLKLGSGGFLPNLTFEIGVSAPLLEEIGWLCQYENFITAGSLVESEVGPDVPVSTGTLTLDTSNKKFGDASVRGRWNVGIPVADGLGNRSWRLEGWIYLRGNDNTFNFMNVYTNVGSQSFQIAFSFSGITSIPFTVNLVTQNISYGGSFGISGQRPPNSSWVHWAIQQNVATKQWAFYMNGKYHGGDTGANVPWAGTQINLEYAPAAVTPYDPNADSAVFKWIDDEDNLYPLGDYTIPTEAFSVDQSGPLPWYELPFNDEGVKECVDSLMNRAQYETDEWDSTALEDGGGIYALYLSQVAPTRSALELIASAKYLTWSKSDKIYFRFRETATAGAFDIEDLGVSDSPEGSDNPIPIKNTSQIEQPAQISLTYNNMPTDFNQAVVSSDVLVTEQRSTNAIQIPMGMVPTEAQGVVESMLLDQVAARVQYGPFRVPLSYAKYEPSDVVTLTDTAGAEHRVRLVKKTDMGIMLEFEGVGDDEGALIALGNGDDTNQGQIEVEQASGSVWVVGDWPLMRDADNNAGYLIASRSSGSGDYWPGAQFVRSWDDVSFTQVATFTTACVIGTCTTTLPNFTAGNVWDESSTLRVNVGSGELSSSTKATMQADLTINTAMVGSECIRFRTATLVSPGVYDLNSLIRGFRGTEWAKGSHVASEDFVLLDSATRRVDLNTGQIGVDQYVKAVTFNLPLSSETSELFTYNAVNLKPFSVANLRCLETSDGDLDLTWDRRTRLSYAYGGTIGQSVPLGEATELHRVYVYDGSNLVRTEEVTAQGFLYTAAMMTSDGFVSSDAVTFEVVQVSEIVGDGYSAEIEGVIP